jgi:protein ImuA
LSLPLAAPETLHPTLWRASQVGRPRAAVFASGFAALDAVLPGGGWPAGALTELLLPHPGVGEVRLLAPVLARLQRQQHERCLMWFDPPAAPCAWALRALGLQVRQLVLVRLDSLQGMRGCAGSPRDSLRDSLRESPRDDSHRSRFGSRRGDGLGNDRATHPAAALLWALEHALGSGHVGAVLAWLPARLPADAMRRLQLAAQAHEGPAFVLRSAEAARQASPAPLRLALSAAAPDWLRVQVLKRRGPPLAQPLLLELAPVLAAPAAGRIGQRAPREVRAGAHGGAPAGVHAGAYTGADTGAYTGTPTGAHGGADAGTHADKHAGGHAGAWA